MADHQIVIKIFVNKTIFKEITEQIDFQSNKLNDYVHTIKKLQKETNIALTELVNLENSGTASTGEEDESGEEEEDVIPSPKRKNDCKNYKSKKIKS